MFSVWIHFLIMVKWKQSLKAKFKNKKKRPHVQIDGGMFATLTSDSSKQLIYLFKVKRSGGYLSDIQQLFSSDILFD